MSKRTVSIAVLHTDKDSAPTMADFEDVEGLELDVDDGELDRPLPRENAGRRRVAGWELYRTQPPARSGNV